MGPLGPRAGRDPLPTVLRCADPASAAAARATLDLRCGEGSVTRLLAEQGYSAVGVDVAPDAIRLAREADPDGTYVVGDMIDLPFEDASFDLALSRLSFQDVDDLDAAAREAARVLRRGTTRTASP